MVRQPARHPPRLTVRRRFVPSRGQARVLAFAFEQALPLIQRPRTGPNSQQHFNFSNENSYLRSFRSGACS